MAYTTALIPCVQCARFAAAEIFWTVAPAPKTSVLDFVPH